MSARKRLPQYSLHKPSGQAYVRIEGRFHYLGLYESPESKSLYGELIDAWRLRVNQETPLELTVGELVLLYFEHAKTYLTQERQTHVGGGLH